MKSTISARHLIAVVFLGLASTSALAQAVGEERGSAVAPHEEYLLGPNDQIKIWALGLDEISEKSYRLDPAG